MKDYKKYNKRVRKSLTPSRGETIIRQRYVKESVVKNKENVSSLFQDLGDSDDKEGSRSGKPSEGTDAELTALGVGDGRKTWIQLSRGVTFFKEIG